jgi:hypothetical protein
MPAGTFKTTQAKNQRKDKDKMPDKEEQLIEQIKDKMNFREFKASCCSNCHYLLKGQCVLNLAAIFGIKEISKSVCDYYIEEGSKIFPPHVIP